MPTFHAYAADKPKGEFKKFEYDPGALPPDGVEIDVQYCGLCHSDLSMLDNEWGMSKYPLVAGHEVVGKVAAVGEQVPELKVGQSVGLGWYSKSCTHCMQCLMGAHNRCVNAESTIVGRYGGFGDKVRCHWTWATPIPTGVELKTAGPLFCGGITAFTPFVQHDVKPTGRVGVIGIGGLGHLAIQFADKWGCEVTAFSTSADKEKEANGLGADNFVNSKDNAAMKKIAGSLDLIINTVPSKLPWDAYVEVLAPGGALHTVGVAPEFGVQHSFPLIAGQKSLSGSPLGSPATTRQMLDFCARHQIAPVCETLPIDQVNDAVEKLRSGSPRYRMNLSVV